MTAANTEGAADVTAAAPDPDEAQRAIEYCYEQGWSDGLPLVPVSRPLLDEFLATTDKDPEEIIGSLEQVGRDVSVYLAAVNAAMAGCRPGYFPVVLAAFEALMRERAARGGGFQSTSGPSPLIVVNGPIARQIGMNAGGNVFGSGNRANATIGRAVRLMLLSVGGGIPGELDKSTLGHPGKYTFCIAENEEASPWAPYHVEHGYAPDDSTVLVIGAEAPHSVTTHISDDPQGILDSIAFAMSTIAHNNAVLGGSCAVVIGLEHARTIVARGTSANRQIAQFNKLVSEGASPDEALRGVVDHLIAETLG